ncbi:unnamed protein product, partial [Prunus brigantina]
MVGATRFKIIIARLMKKSIDLEEPIFLAQLTSNNN